MADNNNNKKPEKEGMSKATREDLRRMTIGLTDQTTIETLSRAGMMAKNKREQSHFHRDMTVARDDVAGKKEAEAEEDKDTGGGGKEQSKKQT
ncbi:uncharacterized protein FFB20_06066 [Fusarium fujikuroi]|uniref:Uncharacterized protein n=1 Tax=Gibberella fujikuroi (strain CBS 195.34 / IMI 58289 / NRRL A-6831) TaxID=1279085 RepID=S0E4G6_GIBF5|nr:uncharacterized protein FFUJ_05699 [Fusarium fujikuroi IMI 58289]KLO84519.1 uncharacterized protein LW93_1319 [Fusarium fujikuroi]CCT69784.1 uncharacterized protein FFUJ_05699 [Fusarium fujikuroi IMI 58289]SCN80091.1 uncharacterized protein FFB20_06066 [Fusarium fujikuroi]SCN86479.1 uncharacterized protein FFM5_03930 [Fusarium fujikuroi]SCV34689.1 uncharacterized protein FFB14_05125 [Fusarium fujikuroi]